MVSSRKEEFVFLDYFMYGISTQIFLYGVSVEIYNTCWWTRKFKSDDADLPLRHVKKKARWRRERCGSPLLLISIL